MREVTVKYKLYTFEELSTEAKEKVKQWYLEDELRPMFFEEMVNEDLKNLFPNSELEVQFALGYCQGDGLNIYGKLIPSDIIDAIDNGWWGDDCIQEYKEFFTDKEKRTIKFYMDCYSSSSSYPLEMNRISAYCIVDQELKYMAETLFGDLEEQYIKNINKKLLKKLQSFLIDVLVYYCKMQEKAGYQYFYEADDEEVGDFCEANGYEFKEDGELWRQEYAI